MKIVIIGGHHISALVLAKLFKNRGHKIYWFGTRFPRWPEKTEGIEYRQVKEIGLPFFDIKAGKFHYNLLRWWRIPLGFFQSLWYLRKLKPDYIFSFGGYLAVPVVISGWFLGIASFSHEQTRTAGLANRFLQYFVKKIFLSWPESALFFKKDKIIVVGLPLRQEIISPSKTKHFKSRLPTIFVVGGKQGSHIVNNAIHLILNKLLSKYNLIHQCGDILNGKDYYKFQQLKESLPRDFNKRYLVRDFFNDKEMGVILNEAELIVGRSGAHIVYELALLGKPAIFIPLPFSFAQEQYENAKLFVQNGAAEIIPQDKLTGELLLTKINEVMTKIKQYKDKAQSLKTLVVKDAAEKIVDILEDFYAKQNQNS